MNRFAVLSFPSLLFFFILNVLVRPAQALTLIGHLEIHQLLHNLPPISDAAFFCCPSCYARAAFVRKQKKSMSKHGHFIMAYTVDDQRLLTPSKCNCSLFTQHKYINWFVSIQIKSMTQKCGFCGSGCNCGLSWCHSFHGSISKLFKHELADHSLLGSSLKLYQAQVRSTGGLIYVPRDHPSFIRPLK